ncbi:hypothetical protein ACVWZA_000452 [Sphingomonas sp. UYAg733]
MTETTQVYPPVDGTNAAKVEAMRTVLAPLWGLQSPGPDNLYQHPAFAALKAFCEATYPSAEPGLGSAFALGDALRALGLPCSIKPPRSDRVGSLEDAAERFVHALEAMKITQRYLSPLDWADTLPDMEFGRAFVGSLSRPDLAALFDAPRLARLFPAQPLDVSRLAQFHWLVVEEEVLLTEGFAERALPMKHLMQKDFGEIEVHAGEHSAALTDALFGLLLAPWEDWHSTGSGDWRAFRIPWIHVETGDLFIRPKQVPPADQLSWTPFHVEEDGEQVEIEVPLHVSLYEEAEIELPQFGQRWWAQLEIASSSVLFTTPIKHFLVRAFFSDGMDEIMAHMTTIEAALGMHEDFTGPRPSHAKKLKVHERMARRIAALLGDLQLADDYRALFELRSKFVHGRAIANKVPSIDRIKARRLARKVVVGVIDAANGSLGQQTREDYLWSLA